MDTGILFSIFLLYPMVTLLFTSQIGGAEKFDGDAKSGYKKLLPPRVQMLRRVVRNFSRGKEATITLVFHSTRDVNIRWFQKMKDNSYEGSEIPGFFPLTGNPRVSTRRLVADDVVAASLKIHRYKAEYPDAYTVVISDGSVQYNLKTDIGQDILVADHKINSPEWDWLPQDVTFDRGQPLRVSCQAFVLKELEIEKDNVFNKHNQLYMNRIIGKLDIDAEKETILKIHRGIDPHEFHNISEQKPNDPQVIRGFREPTKYNDVLYQIEMSTSNASSPSELEGIYQCYMERQDQQGVVFEKSFANSEVVLRGHSSPYLDYTRSLLTRRVNNRNLSNKLRMMPQPSIPQRKSVRAILKPCQENYYINNKSEDKRRLQMVAGQKSCFRCVAMGYPQPKLSLIKDGERIFTRTDITTVQNVNVADGGLVEVTYIFHNPKRALAGNYRCQGQNSEGRSVLKFKLEVI